MYEEPIDAGTVTEQSVPDGAEQAAETTVEEGAETLADFVAQTEEQPAQQAEPAKTETEPAKEPSWFQARLARERRKWEAESEAKVNAMLAPIRKDMEERTAQELVKSGEFKSIERAREYVQLKGGNVDLPGNNTPEQPRQQNGQYAPKANKVSDERAAMLAHQVERIKANTGVDMMEEFNAADRETQARVLGGEIDFHDLYAENHAPAKKTPPKTMTTPNGQMAGIDIAHMSDAQFRQLQANLGAGKKYDVRG